jgi:putative ABC transport system permease protein
VWRFVSRQLRHRPHRAAVLAGAILVAAVSFVLLASAAKTSELKVRGSVKSNFRTAYDILVRPAGSRTQLEKTERLVRPNFLSGIFGGISFRQYDEIKHIRGVAVAAPVANIGYVLLRAGGIPIELNGLLDQEPVQLYRVRTSWRANNGTSTYPGSDLYVYYTRRDRFTYGIGHGFGGTTFPTALEEVISGHQPVKVCEAFNTSRPRAHGPFDLRKRSGLVCFSARSPGAWWVNFSYGKKVKPKGVGTVESGYFPVFLAAIDPVQEARLVGLDHAIVSGRYLREDDSTRIRRVGSGGNRWVPVIAATRTFVDETLQADVERLRVPHGVSVPDALASDRAYSFLASLQGRVVAVRKLSPQPAYDSALTGGRLSGVNENQSESYWTVSPVRYRKLGADRLKPIPTRNPISVYANKFMNFINGGYWDAPAEGEDLQFRRLFPHLGNNLFLGNVLALPNFQIVGRYDAAKLPGFSPLSKVPLETYFPPALEPADRTSRRALGGKPLLPTQNLGDYIQQPPLLLTTLQGLRAFTNPKFFTDASGKAPISVIRVRVAGVKGPDPLSIARIKAAALQIHQRTGLDVDITAGSSPHRLLVSLPRGKFGRPPLLLSEGWSKKGVSVAFLQAVDRKSLILFALIPVICAFFLVNGAFATVRARRAEIGTLLTQGWTQAAIFRAVLGEIGLIGLCAGLVGTGIAAALVSAFSLHASSAQVVLVLPLSLGLALVSGLLPAWWAARSIPLDAVRPTVAGREGSGHARSLSALALVNLRRLPARTLVAVFGLAVGTAALTLLVGIDRSFSGTLVGTVLGSAILVQVHGFDFASVGLVIGLAGLAVADVLFLNLRERAPELVTLRTVGWGDRHLVRLLALEALGLGLAGGLLGAVLGLVIGAVLAVPIGPLVLAALAASAGAVAVATLASLLPVSQITRLTPPTVLAAE